MSAPRVKRRKTNRKVEPQNNEGPAELDWSTLPSEIYIRIFGFLPFEDQQCSMLVNKKWCALLQLPEFAKKSSLALEYCIISPKCPPWSVLIKSKRKFLNLRFGECFKNYAEGKDTALWKHLGKNVESCTIRMEGTYTGLHVNALHNFPKLRHLSIPWEDLMMFSIPRNIESVVVKGAILSGISPKDAAKFKELRKHLKFMSTKRIFLHFNDEEKGEVSIFHTSVYNYIEHLRGIYAFQIRLPLTLNLLEIDDITPEHVTATYESDMDTIDVFPNVKRITLSFETNGCFFVHQQVKKLCLDKVKTVEIDTHGQMIIDYCLECLENLVNSCPNFNGWKLVGKEKVWKLQRLLDSSPKPLKKLVLDIKFDINDLSVNYPQLEKLKLCGTTESLFIRCSQWPHMPKLRQISITSQDGKKLMLHNFNVLVQNCPAVVDASFDMLLAEQILRVEQGWKNLRKLHIYNSFEDAAERSLIESFKGNFRSLRILGFARKPDFKPYKYHAKIFEKIPTLRECFVMNYTKYCLYEYKVPKIFNYQQEFVQQTDDEEENNEAVYI